MVRSEKVCRWSRQQGTRLAHHPRNVGPHAPIAGGRMTAVTVTISAPRPALSAKAAAFLLGVSCFLQIHLIGQLYLAEPIFAYVAVIGVIASPQVRKRVARIAGLLALSAGWLFLQVATDLIHHVSFTNYTRGWASIAFFAADLLLLVGVIAC